MAFYTPNGLYIRVRTSEAFTLMARLYPARTPADILTTTEALEALPFLFWQTVAMVALVADAPPVAVVALSLVVEFLATLLLWYGWLVERPIAAAVGAMWNRI